MRDAAIAVIREIGVETGGSNIQFAISPVDGRMVVIEMNPRVSRSSALASKAIGRTFKEALQKAIRSLEQDRWGLTLERDVADLDELKQKIRVPNAERCFAVAEAYRRGLDTEELHRLSAIDPWFLENIRQIVEFEPVIRAAGLGDPAVLRKAKQMGFSDRRIGVLVGATEAEVRSTRLAAGFEAHTPYLYSTYEEEDEALPTPREKVVILGSGPNRIGQGIEFDYACVHAAFALREAGV